MMPESEADLHHGGPSLHLALSRAGLRLIVLLGLEATWRLRSWRKLGTLM